VSDQSGGPGWWVASDGKWYPPATGADAAPEAPTQPAAAPPAAQWDGTRWVDPTTGQWWDGTAWHARSTVAAAPAAAPTPSPAPAPAPAPGAFGPPADPAAHPGAPGRSGKGPLVAVGIVGILILLVAGFVVLRSRQGPSLSSDVVADGAVASGADELPSSDIALTDATVVVRGNGGTTLKSMAADGSTLTLDGGVEGVDQLEPGSILLLTGVTVVKVTDVQRDGDDVVIGTEAASIGEVIRDGSISWDEVPTSSASIQVWDAGPDDLEVEDSTLDDQDPATGDGTTADDTTTDDTTADDEDEGSMGPGPTDPGNDVWREAQHALAAATAPTGRGATFLSPAQADPIDKSGKIGDYTYSFSKVSGADGSSTYKLGLTKEGNYVLKLDLDAEIDTIISSGDLQVSNSTLDKLHLKSNKFNGKAKLAISAGTGETIAPVKQEILTIPVSINFPIVVYGIPFAITVKGKFLIEPAFTSKNATVSGQAEVNFGGTAGLTYEGGTLSAEGAMTQKGEDPMEYVNGLGVGVTGIVFASQFPRLGFGLGYGSSSAGVYLASTTSAGITISSAIGMVPCNSISITNTTSAGAEAAFIGIDLPLGDKAKTEISKETWNFYAPDSEACKNMSGG
jgi:hypothetical protein